VKRRAIPKQELPVEIGYIDGVHINDIDLFEAGKGKILENLTAEAAGSNDEDSVCFKIALCLDKGVSKTHRQGRGGRGEGPPPERQRSWV